MRGMAERPPQLPEGRLLARAQKRAGLSGRRAADAAGMSEGHWRAIVSGSRSISRGVWVPVRAPAETLARMAHVVGLTPEQLEQVGREDAAEELRTLAGEQTQDEHEFEIPTDREEQIRLAHELIARANELTAQAQQLLKGRDSA